MNEPKWYVVGTDGIAELHRDRAHAEATVARRACGGEFKAVQLVDAAELEAANARIAELESELAKYSNHKNWTRPFDMDGKLIAEHALYLPRLRP